MTISIRELKRRYKMNLALGQALPTFDRAIPLPLSTGNALYDAALTDKLVATTTLNEPEHLNRAWHLVRTTSAAERTTLARHANLLLNDYRLLLAIRAWEEGDGETTRRLLRSLPWGWRLTFPTALIKPAAVLFTGWRKTLNFRLVEEPRYEELRGLFRELLAQVPGPALLRYAPRVQEAAALLRFRFEGEREQAIHSLCFNKGRDGVAMGAPEPVGTYLRARHALATGGVVAMLDALNKSEHTIPITSYMGLLSRVGVRLDASGHPAIQPLRDYAVRCATAVESLLRLAEWGSWLTEEHAALLGARVRETVIDRGLDIPFFKVVKAFTNAPQNVRKLVLQPLFLPLLEHFGRQVSGLLPAPAPLSFVQPGNVIHIMSFLLYTLISSAMPSRLLLLYKNGVEEVPPLDLQEVASHLADDERALERWLLHEFGGLTTHYRYEYDYTAIGRTLTKLDPQAPLLLDLPFAESMDVLSALLPFERVFNLSNAYGAPGEVCIAYEYYQIVGFNAPGWRFNMWQRYSDSAAQRFGEFLERLRAFQTLAAEVQL
jgi:hypothetical protein